VDYQVPILNGEKTHVAHYAVRNREDVMIRLKKEGIKNKLKSLLYFLQSVY